jgi:hypothetical protein
MKVWLILAAVTAGVLLKFGALRAKTSLASNHKSQGLPDAQPSSEKREAASANLSALNELATGIDSSGDSSVAATVSFLDGLPEGDQQRDLARELLTKLFEKDPTSAAEFVAALHEPLNIQMAAALATLWGEKDARSAAKWAKNLPPSPVRSHALLSLCADWAAADPQSAANFVINSPASDFPIGGGATSSVASPADSLASDVHSQMIFIIGNRWVVQNSGEAIKSVGQLPAGPDRDLLIVGITSSLAESSPSDAATLVASMTPGQQQNDAALTVLLEWGRSDPQAAANWLKLFPTGEFRDKAIHNLTVILAEQEPDSAKSVLLDWPDTTERARAIRSYLNETLDTDASRGASVLAGVEDSSLLLEETERVAQHWLMQEPSAALEWLDASGLDGSTRMHLLSAPGLAIQSPF